MDIGKTPVPEGMAKPAPILRQTTTKFLTEYSYQLYQEIVYTDKKLSAYQNTYWEEYVEIQARMVGILFAITTVLMASLVLANTLVGVFYDTDHFGDTLFILGAGWRTTQGLTPVVDFGDFYGGVIANGIGLTMRLFGSDVFAFDRFTLLLLAGLSLSATAILRARMSFAGLMALFLTFAVLMLSRYPLETDAPIVRIFSTHSFLYNRFGLALLLVSGLFVALRASTDRDDFLPGILIGLLVVLAALTKPTFIVLAPGVLLGLALQQRWKSLAAVLIGMGASVAIFDPTLQKWLGSLIYIQAHLGTEVSADIGALLRKAVQLPLSQPIATTFALAALGVVIAARTDLAAVLSLLIVAGAGIGMATSMGGNGNLGQLSIVVAILVALAAGEIARRSRLRNASSVQAVAFLLVVSLAFPHLLNLAAATLEGFARRDQMLISEGPYARYLSLPENANKQGEPTQYEMLADGIASLHALGEPSQWGIIADHGITFEHAVLAQPVPGYPLWQRLTAPELAEGKPIAPEVDIVMLGRSGPDEVGEILAAKLSNEFALCTTSTHWAIHVRRSSAIDCQGN